LGGHVIWDHIIGEDNLNDLLFLTHHFRREQILNPLRHVTDGESVISYLNGDGTSQDEENPFPILLMLSLKLPGRSALEILEWMQADPRLQMLPVVVLNEVGEVGLVAKAHQFGAKAFLTKPILSSQFRTCLREIKGLDFAMGNEKTVLATAR
jgi:CheY-like chemotaxis protein